MQGISSRAPGLQTWGSTATPASVLGTGAWTSWKAPLEVLSYYIISNIKSTAVLVFKSIYCGILQTYRNKTQTTHR